MLKNILWVFLGGGLGSVARYLTGFLISKHVEHAFPVATLSINLLGCALIGFLYGVSRDSGWMQQTGWLLLVTGFCGGFTTFSTFAFENVLLLEGRAFALSAGYLAASIAGGLILCRLGMLAGQRL